ncbi:MAG: penicillin-binding protein 1C [Rhodoferax ferrireducens]|uniref:peptidoglycan glycosyltransferase n=1 Tax=Rhodoferax ferrireducens TaxID=192843 RepID=A0A1W9KV34_9BURK|nr:MAG: penicillin-binding protein 1C [Rhodoferax ferrireducens]
MIGSWLRWLAILFAATCAHSTWAAASFDEIKASWQPSDTVILDRHGEVLQRVRTDATVRRGQWLALADISPALRTALVLSEDKRFYEHSGVDWHAVSAAAWANLWATKTRGASTITMQLAGLLDDDLKRSAGGRSVLQKVQQTMSAQWLERRWRKDQILEAYLNLVPFRGELVGIDALSQTLFGKAAHGLDEREAAVAAALVRAPNAKPALVAQRACAVLKNLHPANGVANCDALELFTTGTLQRRDFAASAGIAPHAARQVLRVITQQRGPEPYAVSAPNTASTTNTTSHTPRSTTASQLSPASITTTLSAPLQRFAVQTLQQHLRELRGRQVEDGAIVVLDNASGQVLAWVGSSGELSSAAEVDGVTALRQPGSTLKPFLYAQAFAQRRLTAASLLDDSGAQIQTSGGLYIPQNYDHQFKGWVSVRTALGASLNVPAVRTLVMVSPDAFHKQLVALGLPLKESGDYYGYSLALGSAEVSLLTLANAYRALGNGGRLGATSLLPGDKPAQPSVLDARAAFIVGDILSDPLARARTFGSDSILATRFWSAAKTGTSKDMRDNWALGWSQAYTVGVWVGNASGAPMWDVSGTSGAAPIWAAVMHYLHQSQPSRAPKPPAGVLQLPVQFVAPEANTSQPTPLEAARTEWFIQGTQQALFAIQREAVSPYDERAGGLKGLKLSSTASARITAPTSGTIIALDPDVPPKNQRVTFTAVGNGLRWRIDGKAFASGNSAHWLPWPGRHVVQITDTKGRVLDDIRLEVRGAGVVGRR